ncbi:MBL fold metallo-hydrolase [Microbacterium sp.]|uniref:MBL fold metallo-hydrolase n=1 Tax=Microbacterium sp. TaxID=51671 RepID=UPI00273467AC|nr:MBL fold metallo-hydrolase [Microbacterium sp.]MDP3950265.1 MBL fold metallo-hydrolase [Microbacterium sp.]
MATEISAVKRAPGAAPTLGAHAQHAAWQQRHVPDVEQVRDRVWSVSTQMPKSALGYTLSYLLETDEGLVLIDNGWLGDESWAALESGIRASGHVVGDVSDVLLTHTHIDHHGLSRRIVEASGARLHMHRLEARALERDIAGRQVDFPRWLEDRGVPFEDADALMGELGSDSLRREVAALPPATHEFEDDDRPIGALPGLRVVFTPGHTAGHACFLLEPEGLLFSGDHVLPRITPHVTRPPGDKSDPLTDYLDSLRIVRDLTVSEVLPAHEYRFADLRGRVDTMLAHHEERLDEIEAATPGSTWEIAAAISWARGWDATSGVGRQLALNETFIHLTHLARAGRVRRTGQSPDLWEISQ